MQGEDWQTKGGHKGAGTSLKKNRENWVLREIRGVGEGATKKQKNAGFKMPGGKKGTVSNEKKKKSCLTSGAKG